MRQTGSPPWLSVLVPVFNGAATLGESLASVAGQADGIEVIVVDQGSTDASVEIAEGFRDRMDIRIIPAPDNENWIQNTNLALARARAALTTMLHQDDLWRPGRTALLTRMQANAPDAALWVHAADYIDAQGEVIGRFAPPFGGSERTLPGTQALSRLLVQNTIALPAAMFPTQAARAIGGLDDDLWYTADWDLWLKLAQRGPVAWSPEVGAGFRVHRGSQTVRGSRDLDDFRHQLQIPLDRHLQALPNGRVRARTRRLAQTSNALNVWLAGKYHGERPAFRPLIAQVLRLRPTEWMAFLRDSQLVARVRPRLSLRRR